ncbi:MAG: serine/threonine-protein kinase [Armatimonadota bacterium]
MSTGVTFGKYRILGELGRGAMGVVYEAFDPERETEVALKVIGDQRGRSPASRERQVERFCREARALARLRHPYIVRFYDQGELNGRHYFSMERVRGTTLRERLQFQGALSLPELTRLLGELADALDHLHAREVVHRDIKPENIMLLPDGTSKLMDFGIARILTEEDTAATTGFQGSPAYMSPEQAAGRPVDGRSDIFSLSVVLYEAATGRRAFQGESIPEIVRKVTEEYPPPPVGLPRYFELALLRAMAKDPTQRYARASEMAEDVRAQRLPAIFNARPAPKTAPARPPYLGAIPDFLLEVSEVIPPLPTVPAALRRGSTPPIGDQAAFRTDTVRVPCRYHPSYAGVDICGTCGAPVCHTCLVEVVGRGVHCRVCSYGKE